MQNLRQFVFAAFVALFAASSTAALFAEADPPSRVARLKYISGQVSMQPGGVNDWAGATINRPMTTADRLWTDKDSRAELRLGNAAMRMNSETSLTLTNLSDNTVQLELDQGTLNLDVTRVYNGEIYEVDTPNMAFTLTKPGAYRFDVDSQSDTTFVTVWNGRGIATGNGEAVKIDSHKQVRFSDGMSLMHAMYGAPRPDGFDEWCQVRSDREAHILSARYVSADVVGYEDLDGYGTWQEVPTYGRVWVPVVAAGWAPYSVGHWVWIEPWGWTWVDDAPWGFAPFHYGRWVFAAGAWAWAPGPVYVRPVYAPALVAWVGSSGAGIGWFPLGYGEPYIPSYHVSRGYFESVNISNTRITNITYVTNTYYNVTNVHITNIHYVNQSVPGGMTVVNNEVIVNSRPVNHNVFIGHDDDWRDHHDRWVAAAPACAPSRDSVLGVHADERARMPERINQRPVVVKMTPPPRHEPFEPRRGDNDRPWNSDDHRADGHMPNPQHGNDDASNRGYGQGKDADHDRNDNDDARRDPIADRGRDFPHPGRGHDDDRGQQNANNGQNQNGQNQNAQNGNSGNTGNDDDRGRRGRPDWAGVPHEGSSDSPRYPHPPRSSDGDHSQASSAGNHQPGNSGQQNGNGDQNQNAYNGNANGNDNGNNNGRRGRPDWTGVPHQAASGAPNYPRPSSSANNDHSEPSSAGNNQPGPSNQNQGSEASDDRGNHGRGNGNGPNRNNGQAQNANNNGNANSGNTNNGSQQAQGPAWSRPNQDGNWGNRQVPRPPAQPANNGQGNGMSSGMERPSQPVYQAPAASQPQAERDIPRPREGVTNRPQPVTQQQTENQRDYPMPQRQMRQPSYSAPNVPPQHAEARPSPATQAAPPQRASQPEPRPAPTRDAGGNGNSHGAAQFQDRDHGKVQDR
ncbi:MAG TPA: DUF6600 domain-containing protein [Candidatus Sulfotelmatobacter sp.]|nr:DUF6600 domain-containing protein [Candidatus Sulfotelmatobacter sp.]